MLGKVKRMKCPVCGSTRISSNPSYGFKCRKCGYEHRKKISMIDMAFKRYAFDKDDNLVEIDEADKKTL